MQHASQITVRNPDGDSARNDPIWAPVLHHLGHFPALVRRSPRIVERDRVCARADNDAKMAQVLLALFAPLACDQWNCASSVK